MGESSTLIHPGRILSWVVNQWRYPDLCKVGRLASMRRSYEAQLNGSSMVQNLPSASRYCGELQPTAAAEERDRFNIIQKTIWKDTGGLCNLGGDRLHDRARLRRYWTTLAHVMMVLTDM